MLDLGARAVKRHDDLRFVHQDLGLVPDMNAVDNMALTHGFRHGRFGRIDWAAQREFTRQALERFGTSIDIDTPLESLSAVVCTEIAIAAAMHGWEAGQGVLVLDEPTAMLRRPRSVGSSRSSVGPGVRRRLVLYVSTASTRSSSSPTRSA